MMNHVQLKPFDVLKENRRCNIFNWFTMLLLGTWQFICRPPQNYQVRFYSTANTMATAFAPTYLLPGLLFWRCMTGSPTKKQKEETQYDGAVDKKAEQEENQKVQNYNQWYKCIPALNPGQKYQ